MAYNNNNKNKHIALVMEVYHKVKQPDRPDTKIVAFDLPQHNIHISYRTLMNYKAKKPSEYLTQLSLFAV
ncbi:hypothetical protein [Pedobacter sp.]|uniref:hypothetical protein n=1 Tax=Pedobacter sp. TaxID=1411316 RepID=UPI00396CE955